MEENYIFAKRLKEARLKSGYSQRKLGLDANLDPEVASPRINRYESGKHFPKDLRFVQKLAHLLNVPLAYFFCPEEDLKSILQILGKVSAKEREALLHELNSRFPRRL